MNGNELTDEVAQEAGLLKLDTEHIMRSLKKVLSRSLAAEKEVTVPGIGRFFRKGSQIRFVPDKRFCEQSK